MAEEVVSGYSSRFPGTVVSHNLGPPYEDHTRLSCTHTQLSRHLQSTIKKITAIPEIHNKEPIHK